MNNKKFYCVLVRKVRDWRPIVTLKTGVTVRKVRIRGRLSSVDPASRENEANVAGRRRPAGSIWAHPPGMLRSRASEPAGPRFSERRQAKD